MMYVSGFGYRCPWRSEDDVRCLGLEFEVYVSYPTWLLGPLQEQHWLLTVNH